MKNAAPLLLACLVLGLAACDRKPRASKSTQAKRASSAAVGTNRLEGMASQVAWRREVLLENYHTIGRQGAWDSAAEKAFNAYAELGTKAMTREGYQSLTNSIQEAVDAGCDDPMIRYMHSRFIEAAKAQEPLEASRLARASAELLDNSGYHSVFKFYANLAAWRASQGEIDFNAPLSKQMGRPRMMFGVRLLQAVNDPTVPDEEIYLAVMQWLPAVERGRNRIWSPNQEEGLEPELARRAESVALLVVRAKCAIASAFNARGTGYADSVTPEGWKLYGERLARAEGLLNRAWEIDPKDSRVPTTMLAVIASTGPERDVMEKWFARAMQLDTNNYDACVNKLHYLKPQWHGSKEEMLEFGRQCLATNWGGNVPLIMADAHYSLSLLLPRESQLKYWTDREVWRDIDQTFKRFFALNPEDTDHRHNYAWYAFHAGEWQTFKEQLLQFKGTNYAYFGSKEEFERMVAKAEAVGK